MDGRILFGLIGLAFGVAAGSSVTYILCKKDEDMLIDEIEYWQGRYRKLKSHEEEIPEIKENEEDPTITDRLTPDVPILDEKIDNNKGVKKYHTQVDSKGLENRYKEALGNVTEGEKALVREDRLKAEGKEDENDYKVYEISEDDYISDPDHSTYDKVTLDYYIEDDTLVSVDPEEIAETYYKCGREEIIGKVWRWAPDYIREGNNDGVVYVRNDGMSTDFEIIVHNSSYKELAGLD